MKWSKKATEASEKVIKASQERGIAVLDLSS